ncbi:hypothetical protein Acr_00g0004790 [Actinidia rufa]|uniref:Uncharacterized protein n=1 Tax=Actinidia rufa TaxID=165716 RepID=A0A7J0D7I8_9ERIC|nr:hypothetical protein Acr_00g0004790 [Actinidia rufa]
MTLSRFRQGLNDDLRKELVLREVDTLDQAYTFVQNYEMVSKPSFGRRFDSRNTPRHPATLPPSRPVPNTAPLLRDGKEKGILAESPGMKSTLQCYTKVLVTKPPIVATELSLSTHKVRTMKGMILKNNFMSPTWKIFPSLTRIVRAEMSP